MSPAKPSKKMPPVPAGIATNRQDLALELEKCSLDDLNPNVPSFSEGSLTRHEQLHGREDLLKELDGSFFPDASQSEKQHRNPVVLYGTAGVGKSEVALEFAFSRREKFDAVFWVRSDTKTSFEADLAHIAVQLKINDPKNPDDHHTNWKRALTWLCDPFVISGRHRRYRRRASWLVIFDNADDLGILKHYPGLMKAGAVLITTRSPAGKDYLPKGSIVTDVPRLDTFAGGALLDSLTGIIGEDREARMVSRRLGGLPIALIQMAGIIKSDSLTYSEFLKQYEDPEKMAEMLKRDPGKLRATARGTLMSIWGLQDLRTISQKLLEPLSFLRPHGIPANVLKRGESTLNKIAFPETSTSNDRYTRYQFEAMEELVAKSIITEYHFSYRIDRVLQDVIRSIIPLERRHVVFSSAVLWVLESWPTRVDRAGDGAFWKEAEHLLPNVHSLYEAYKTYFPKSFYLGSSYWAKLLVYASWYEHERGKPHKELLSRLELALGLCNKNISIRDDRDIEVDIRYAIASIASEINDADTCIKHSRELLRMTKDLVDERDSYAEGRIRAHYMMGVSWLMQGDYERAKDVIGILFKKNLSVPDPLKAQFSLAISKLGLVYYIEGDFQKAAKLIEKGLSDRKEVLGGIEAPCYRAGILYYALGKVRFAQGQIKESHTLFQQAVWRYEASLGKFHPRTASAYYKLAFVKLHLGDSRDSTDLISLIDKALAAWKMAPGTYLPDISRASLLKAKALRTLSSDREEETKEADSLYSVAASYHHVILGVQKTDLEPGDFDEMIQLWYR